MEPRHSGTAELRRRSLRATREITAVLRGIRELFAVPWDERDERWEARRAAIEARKVALVAECEAINAARGLQHGWPSPPLAPDSFRPAPRTGVER